MDGHIAELDLHGLSRERAIRAVTDFIEENKRNNVRIITGTGSHSTHGPVLRSAVESLLTRRNMMFNKESAGSFIVNCSSGETFYRPEQPKDTKVVIASAITPQPTSSAQRAISFAAAIPQPQSYSIAPNRTRRVVSTTMTKRIINADGSTEETTSTEERIVEGDDNVNRQERVYAECIYADDPNCGQLYADPNDPICGPWLTPAEAKAEESDYYKALEGSLEDYKKEKMASQQDLTEVDRALEASRKLFEEQEAQRREKEMAELEKAIRLSEKIALEDTKRAEEDKLFLLALERSKSETKYARINNDEEEEDEELKKILELSKQDAMMPRLDPREEEELIRRALEESKQAARSSEHLPDRELEEAIRLALEQSLEEDRLQQEEEDALMKQILGMSLR